MVDKVDKENTVYFYDYETELARKEDIFLNNFDISKFVDPTTNLDYLTVEHYYQCHKFENFEKNSAFKNAFETIR